MRDHSFIRIAASCWHNSIIKAMYVDNVAVISEKGSMINGCDYFDELGEKCCRGPHAIDMSYCTNIRFSGYTVINSESKINGKTGGAVIKVWG